MHHDIPCADARSSHAQTELHGASAIQGLVAPAERNCVNENGIQRDEDVCVQYALASCSNHESETSSGCAPHAKRHPSLQADSEVRCGKIRGEPRMPAGSSSDPTSW